MLVASADERIKDGVFSFSQGRERSLCSPLTAKLAVDSIPRWSIAVLEGVGIFACNDNADPFPRATAREFSFGPKFAERKPRMITLSMGSKARRSWEQRDERLRESFERRNPIIDTVRAAASRLQFSNEGIQKILELRRDEPNCEASARRCYESLHRGPFNSTLDRQGTLHSPVSGCPRSIRPYLVLDGEPTAEMDISGAHLVVLVRVYEANFQRRLRLDYPQSAVEAERRSLIEQIESGDVYGGEAPERKRRKKELLTALNIETKIQLVMDIARELLSSKPILVKAMIAVKRKDHRELSWWLQRWVSEIVNPAVLSLAERGIPGVPIVDCILCRDLDRDAVGKELSERISRATGICATVGK